ncbi:MAG: right-handed parallel beta-helix repeat-containing protein [Opitutales bacterium]|nr:right-handed parallel beta-helix repeat-containing protein [Opitutales bacterium]
MRILSFILLSWMLLGFEAEASSDIIKSAHETSDASKTFYVSLDGCDSNPGNIDHPFATIQRARNAVQALTANGTTVPDGGVVVYVRGGRYPVTETLEFGSNDSGAPGAPIRYRAKPGENVIFDGGVEICASRFGKVEDPLILERIVDKAARPHIRVADLTDVSLGDGELLGPRGFRRAYRTAPVELIADGKPQILARWPNPQDPVVKLDGVKDAGSQPRDGDFALKPATIQFQTDRPLHWAQADRLHISGIFAREWADDTLPIDEIDPDNRTMTTKLPHLYGVEMRDFSSWHAVDLLEEIDMPGEYFIDYRNKKLYWYPDELGPDTIVQLSLLRGVMVAIEDTSHFSLEGFVFENSRGSGIYIEGGDSVQIIGCTLRNLGKLGIQIGRGITPLPEGLHDAHGVLAEGLPEPKTIRRSLGSWHEYVYRYPAYYFHGGRNHLIQSCDIHNTGAGGIHITGGDRKTLKPANHRVDNCNIFRVTRWDRTYKANINVDGVGITIANNHLHQSDGQAIYLRGNDHRIVRNRINDVCRDISDMGAIYIGRDPSELGHLIKNNFFHDIQDPHDGAGAGVQAIFFDDGTLYAATVYGNLFYRAGSTGVIKYNLGGGSSVANNIAIECPPLVIRSQATRMDRAIEMMRLPPDENPSPHNAVQHLRTHVESADDPSGVHVGMEPYRSAYPFLYTTWKYGKDLSPEPWNNFETDNPKLFANPEDKDFRLLANACDLLPRSSDVVDLIQGIQNVDKRFDQIPFESIGLYPDGHRHYIGKDLHQATKHLIAEPNQQ